MLSARFISLFSLGVLTGAALAVQSVLNTALGKRVGVFGTLLVLTVVGITTSVLLAWAFPSEARLRNLPGRDEWYLYLGAFLGIAIMMAPVLLVPRIGATATLTAMVFGQLVLALVMDHFGVLGIPKIEVNAARAAGVAFLVLGAYLISR